ncbi:MAG: VacJ family lipoprotein [Holosporaceae bacterium]|jgi:phospholipid-binding lipoprotein MlaA|nr:VacJ family lipoprotein [Holosporaceae bacterium]
MNDGSIKFTNKWSAIISLGLTACSATHNNPDPHKNFNKDMLEFNLMLDKKILRPAASTYKSATPNAVNTSISNFLWNLKEPFFFINYCATANAECAANSLFRFAINSTIGILGLFDIGWRIGLKKTETSLKATLKKWEIPTGDYLMLPILGPSSTRDAIAEPIAWYIDPVGYFIGFPYMFAKTIFSIINERAENLKVMDANLENTVALYFASRSLYLQKYGTDAANSAEVEEEEDDHTFK